MIYEIGSNVQCETPNMRKVSLSIAFVAFVGMTLVVHTQQPAPAPSSPTRKIVRTGGDAAPALPPPSSSAGSWPSFRGPAAAGVSDGQHLPDRWNGTTGEGILWRTSIPGLAHSSPIVWGDRVFVTTAISSRADATFKRGLYADGDVSEDRSRHKWVLYALEKRTGKEVQKIPSPGRVVGADSRHGRVRVPSAATESSAD